MTLYTLCVTYPFKYSKIIYQLALTRIQSILFVFKATLRPIERQYIKGVIPITAWNLLNAAT